MVQIFHSIRKHNSETEDTRNHSSHQQDARARPSTPLRPRADSRAGTWGVLSHPSVPALRASSGAPAHPHSHQHRNNSHTNAAGARERQEKGAGHSGDHRTPESLRWVPAHPLQRPELPPEHWWEMLCPDCFLQTLIETWCFHCPVMAAQRI